MSNKHGRPHTTVTPAEAKAVYKAMKSPTAAEVARKFTRCGRPVHKSTVAEWKKNHWRPTRPVHSSLDAVIPILAGNPNATVEDLVPKKSSPDAPVPSTALGEANGRRAALEAMRDEALALGTYRSMLVTTTLISEDIREKASTLVMEQPKELGELLESLANTFAAVTEAYSTARDLAMKTIEGNAPKAIGNGHYTNGHADPYEGNPLAAELRTWANVK